VSDKLHVQFFFVVVVVNDVIVELIKNALHMFMIYYNVLSKTYIQFILYLLLFRRGVFDTTLCDKVCQ
jgi:hypothetical protein